MSYVELQKDFDFCERMYLPKGTIIGTLNENLLTMKEQKIKGVLFRYSQKYNLWVNRKGTHVYREYKNKDYNKFLQIQLKTNGSKYLSLTFPGVVEIDLLVTDCYDPKPCDGKEYQDNKNKKS